MNPELALRDIHLPPPVGWWPPAPGWWLLVILLITLLSLTLLWWRKHQRKLAVHHSAQLEFQQIKLSYQQHQNDLQLTQELSVLLRRVAISLAPRNKAAGLTGQPWLAYLDSLVDKPLFDSAPGQQLITAPYQPENAIDTQALLNISEQWLTIAGKKKPVSHA